MYKTADNFMTGSNSVCNSAIWRCLDKRKLRDLLVLKSLKKLGLNHLKTKRRLLYLKTQSVPLCKKTFISVIKTNQFML